jgi:hypothetical protein
LVAKFKYNAENNSYTCPQGETLKPQEDGMGEQNKGYQFKIQNPSLQAIYRTTPFTARPAGREIDREARKALKNNKRYQNPQLYKTR